MSPLIRTGVAAYTYIRADGSSCYRHTVVDGSDHSAAIAEIKRQDMVSPPRPYDYVAFHVKKWNVGGSTHADYWLDGKGRRIACPLPLSRTSIRRVA